MSRFPIPATIADAPAASQPLLEAVKKQLGLAREQLDFRELAQDRRILIPVTRLGDRAA
jgi:hypothetical protein